MVSVMVAMPESLLKHPEPEVSQSRSILSRFTSPLSKSASKVFELSVEPEDAFKVYSPGEVVKGHIVLTVLKGFDITHLVVGLHGYAKVYKHQIAPGDSVPIQERVVNGKGPRGFEYHGNGLVSLFQEEQILCRNGFLKKQVYKFAFEMQFPAKSMPSTIDFERGAVTYMISATVTRPVAIQATCTKHKRIRFQDVVDIEAMNTPKSRVVSLEPINRRGKVKKLKASASGSGQERPNRSPLNRNNTQSSTETSATIPICNPPLSPAPSEDTIATTTSVSSTGFQPVEWSSLPTQKNAADTSDARTTTSSSSAHTITATTELPRHGALPGDSIPVRVSVAHTKPLLKGIVIATLYRLGRVDMHPALPLATRNKDKQPEYEDVYPKSRTGLGGFYFASSTPNSVFRKDLSQSSTMMIVNPNTLSAEISMSVKVPDTAFPTITNVPGSLISFTYHIEVVIDLFGKLGGTRYLPRLTSSEPVFTNSEAGGHQLTHEWSSNILDTAQLRRTKAVVTFELSVTVGTKDSGRNKKRNQSEDDQDLENQTPVESVDPPEGTWYEGWGYEGYDWYYDENGQPQRYDHHCYDEWNGHHNRNSGQDHRGWHNSDWQQPPPPPALIPPPIVEEEVDEKTRLRRQEELLLPSRPPDEGGPLSGPTAHAPTAPILGEESEQYAALPDGIAPPSTPGPPASVVSARSTDTVRPSTTTPPAHAGSNSVATDDKQELERRRLMEQASAPPVDEGEGRNSTADARLPPAPTAPVLDDDDTHEAHATSAEERTDSTLPQYER